MMDTIPMLLDSDKLHAFLHTDSCECPALGCPAVMLGSALASDDHGVIAWECPACQLMISYYYGGPRGLRKLHVVGRVVNPVV